MVKSQARWRRMVVKVGTSTLTAGSGKLNPPRMIDLVRQIAALRAAGTDVVLVTSGAQQAGRERLGTLCEGAYPHQANAGGCRPGRLMHLWGSILSR